MPLIRQTVPVAIGRLETKVDAKWAIPGDLVRAENVVFDNWPRLRKRPGYQQIGAATSGALAAAFKAQLLIGTGSEAFSFTGSGLVDKGILEALSLSVQPVRRDAYAQTVPDSAVHPLGISVYTWETSAGGAQYSVFDTATGQPIVSGASLGSGASRPKPLVLGNYVVVVFADSVTGHLRYVAIPAATPASPGAVTDLALDPNATPVFDATVIGAQLFVAYASNAASIKITFLTLNLTLGAAVVGPAVTPAALSVFGDASNNVWLAYFVAAGAVSATAYSFDLSTQQFAPATVDASPGTVRNITGIVPSTGTSATLFYEVQGGQSYNNLVKTGTVSAAGAVSGVGVLVRSVGLASKPFFYLGRVHVLAAYQSALQATYFLLSGSTVVAKIAPGVGGGLTAKASVLPQMNNPATGVYASAYLQADQLSSAGGNVFTQAGVQAASFDFTQRQGAVELSDDLHLTGGILSMYDGNAVVEHGFHLYPENVSATPSGTGGLMLAGQYQYAVVWEWMDNYGLLHQSAPSPAVLVTTSGSTSSVALTIPTLRLTAKATPISVVVYRTAANSTGPFYRLTSISSPLLNTTAADTVPFTDTVADTSITGNAQLYSNPNNVSAEVPNLPAPAVLHAWRYRNRLAFIAAESPYEWGFSKAVIPGVPVEFNFPQLYQPISQDGGPLVAGIEMDEKNLLFTASRIFYLTGDGPAPNATGSDYGSSPQDISADVGCINRRALVKTPVGVMFQSAKGFYLLTRGLTLEYLGAPVEAYGGATVTASRVMPNSRRVIFTLSTGQALVYDYTGQVLTDGPMAGKRLWAVWPNVNAADLAVFQGLVTYVQPGGAIMQETPGVFTDAGFPILIGLTTSWLSFAGLSGFQRAWRLHVVGDYRGTHKLIVSVAVDGNQIPIQTETVQADTVLSPGAIADTTLAGTDNPGGGAFPDATWLVKLLREKCSSVQIAIQESQGAMPYGEGLSISGLSFLVGRLPGLRPIPAARSI